MILVIVLITFSNYAKQKGDVSKRIGNKIYGGAISTIDFAKVTKVYNTYIAMLKMVSIRMLMTHCRMNTLSLKIMVHF